MVRLLNLVRIPDPENVAACFPHQLSGGMRQRVMIAMALACRPKLLIADEPTTALDVTVQAQILALIRKLQAKSDTGVLFITHDIGVVAEVADRVCVMRYGKIVEEGPCAEVFANPKPPLHAGAFGGCAARGCHERVRSLSRGARSLQPRVRPLRR